MFHVKHLYFQRSFAIYVLLGGRGKVPLPTDAGLTVYLHLPTSDIP
jgi:hypothetical protein